MEGLGLVIEFFQFSSVTLRNVWLELDFLFRLQVPIPELRCVLFLPHLLRVLAVQSEIPAFTCHQDDQTEWEVGPVLTLLD